MNTPVLIVIDMQAAFNAANNPKTIAACQKLILEAKQKIHPIFFLEFKWNGQTLPQLTSLVKDYDYKYVIQKETDDGAAEIERQFRRCRTVPKELIVCGVNTDCCVFSTVSSLLCMGKYGISLVKDACNTDWPYGQEKIIQMKKLGVKVI